MQPRFSLSSPLADDEDDEDAAEKKAKKKKPYQLKDFLRDQVLEGGSIIIPSFASKFELSESCSQRLIM